jgi:hypothetical protein
MIASNPRVPGERSETPDPGATRCAARISQYCASRFLRWVPGLAPLVQAHSLHSSGTRGRRRGRAGDPAHSQAAAHFDIGRSK